MIEENHPPQNILLAIDEHECSERAVEYVGRLTSLCRDFEITIMHVIEDPEDDYFETDRQLEAYLAEKSIGAEALLQQAKRVLVGYGIAPNRIRFRSPVRSCASMASCILNEAEEKFGTLVVGRRGISKSEEMVFGSVSKKLVDYARRCTVWVVQ